MNKQLVGERDGAITDGRGVDKVAGGRAGMRVQIMVLQIDERN